MTDYTSSRLRYVDADKLDTRVLDLDGLDVRNSREDHIGDVEGLLIDTVSGRPRYLVIDSGGWFRSRRFLLPIAHARLDENRRTLRVDFDKETINRFPEMRSDRYEALTDEELQSYDEGVWRSSGVTRPDSGRHAQHHRLQHLADLVELHRLGEHGPFLAPRAVRWSPAKRRCGDRKIPCAHGPSTSGWSRTSARTRVIARGARKSTATSSATATTRGHRPPVNAPSPATSWASRAPGRRHPSAIPRRMKTSAGRARRKGCAGSRIEPDTDRPRRS